MLTLPAMTFSLAQTMLIPALGEIGQALDSDVATVTWLLSGYFVAAAVFTPLIGRLGDMLGKRRLLVLTLLLFAAGNVVSAVGTSVEVVVAGRVIQGVAGGIFPLSFGIARDEVSPERVSGAVGVLSATLGLGGGAGLLLGGLLVDHLGYAAIFWVGAALSMISLAAVAGLVPDSPIRDPGRVDVRGAALLSAALALLLIGITQSATWGWGDPRTAALLSVAVLGCLLWVPLQRRTPHAFIDVRSLARRPVLLTNLSTFLVGFGMVGTYALIPQLVAAPTSTGYGFGASATHAGLLMMPGALAILAVAPLAGALGGRVGHRLTLACGSAVAAVGLGLLAAFHSSNVSVVVGFLVLSTGIGFAFAAMPNLVLSLVPRSQTGQATGVNALIRLVGSALGTQVAAVVVVSSAVGGQPREAGYVAAFALCAVITAVAVVTALLVPSSPRNRTGRATSPASPVAVTVGG